MTIKIANVTTDRDAGLFLIAGPCVIENEKLCLDIAEKLKAVTEKLGIGYIFKASFDKANRSSISSYRGPGLDEGLKVLEKVKTQMALPVLTDIHEPNQADAIAQVADAVQIPAFLCRQTDLLVASAKTKKPVNVKKGQFVSPQEMTNAVGKIRASGNEQVLLTERGTFFGYQRLVNDMTAIPAMQNLGCPVIFDATHSTQQPGGLGSASGGMREMAPLLAKSAIAAGTDGLFLEVHPDPQNAKCDAASMIPLDWVEDLLKKCKDIYTLIRS